MCELTFLIFKMTETRNEANHIQTTHTPKQTE